ncbi:MAG TPA: helix-turn-helix domain-containing protein [Ktedonobacteraceae bacterium]|nr:helix-turn-helix domain-containing protein [Ktedonobacteraceae bacterium]
MQVPENGNASQSRQEITTQEASERSGLSLNHLAYLLRQGKLDGRRFGDRVWMVYVDSLENYLAKPRKPGRKQKKPESHTEKPTSHKKGERQHSSEPDNLQSFTPNHDSLINGRIVVGYQYGEKLDTIFTSKSLYALASPNARWLMELADIQCFAVDDCMIMTNSRNFEGWEMQEIKTTILDTPAPIPSDLELLRQEKGALIEKDYFNAPHYRLISYTPSFSELDYLGIKLAPLNFYDYYSLTPFFDEPLLTAFDGSKISIRQKYGNTAFTYSSTDRGISLIPTPVSIQSVVVTSDEQIILMQRSFPVAFYPNHWSVSFEKTMNAAIIDKDGNILKSGDADFFACAIRGLNEEFAVSNDAIASIKALSLNVEYLTLSVDVITVIKVNLKAEEIRQAWLLKASRKEEAFRFALLSTDLHAVVEKLFSRTLWHPTSRMRLIQYLFHTYGIDEVAKAIKARQG